MNRYNAALLKMGLDVIRNIDDLSALSDLYKACLERIDSINKNSVRKIMIGNVIEGDVF